MSKPEEQAASHADVRMRGFRRRATVGAAQQWIDDVATSLAAKPSTLQVPLADAAGRVLAEAVVSDVNVPGFDRAMMDGYAVRSAETLGASPYNPLPSTIIGQSLPGAGFDGTVSPGAAVRIMTGAPMPLGADCVLPAEKCESSGDALNMLGEVPAGKHVGRCGEDVAVGAEVLSAGRRLRPQDVGVLSSIGCSQVPVLAAPRVHVLITGNELLPPGSRPQGTMIVDANGPMLAALVSRDGGSVEVSRVADSPEEILRAMHSPADVVLVSGGSSVGVEDHAPVLLAEHGELAIHGVAMRPSSPSGMGRLEDRMVFLLPGNPVSCLCAYDFFAGRAIRLLAGCDSAWPYVACEAVLSRKLVSVVGRVDYARVRFVDKQVIEPLAVSGASMLSSTTRADGFVVVPADSEGQPAGSRVQVFRYDAPCEPMNIV